MKTEIRFQSDHVAPIRDKEKRLTIRWNGPEVRSGDGIKFVDADNSQIFGSGIVLDTYEMTVDEVVVTDWEYHDTYRNVSAFNRGFRQYYDRTFNSYDILDVIEWGDTFTPNQFYDG